MHTIDSVFLAHWAVSSAFGTVEGTNGVERQAASAADGEVIRKSYSMLLETVERVQREDRISIEIIAEHSWAQNPYQESGVELAREVAAELGLTHDRVLTVAGHDSTNMKDEVPTVMLFVPSVDGVSHNLQEFTRDKDLLDGLHELTGVMRKLVHGALAEGRSKTLGVDPIASHA